MFQNIPRNRQKETFALQRDIHMLTHVASDKLNMTYID